jgi:hypothetical protein
MPSARRAGAFLALLVALSVMLAAVYDAAARRDPIVKVNWIFAMDGRRFDFIVLGSSRAYHSVDVQTVASAVDGTGVNLGLNGAAYPEVALVLERFLAHNQVRRIALEVDPFGFDPRWLNDRFHPYLYVPYIDERIVSDALEREFGARAVAWRWVPLFSYAEFNERIGLRSVLELAHHPPPEWDAWGSRLSSGRLSDSAVRAIRDTTYRIDPSRVRAFERILDLAEERHVSVTMFMAPQYRAAANAVTNRDQILAFYRELARRRGISFLVFDEPAIEDDPSLFIDGEHLNRAGAMKFSALLGAALRADWADRH